MNDRPRRKGARIRKVSAYSSLLIISVTSACGPTDESMSPRVEEVATTVQLVTGAEILAAADTIGKIYGAYQAGQYLYGLAVGTTAEDAAVTSLRDYRNGELLGITMGLITDVNEILDNPSLQVNIDRIPQVLNDANTLEGRIITAINGGNVTDAHQLAPALNLFAPIHAHMLAFTGNSPAVINAVFAKVLQADFQMVGAWITSRNDPGLTSPPIERLSSVLWFSDGGAIESLCPFATSSGLVVCSSAFCRVPGNGVTTYVDAPACLPVSGRYCNKMYNRNEIVKLIESSMARIIGLGVSTVTASDGSLINLIDPIGREGGIALAGGAGWWSVPVGFSNGDGSFTVSNSIFPGSDSFVTFPIRASQPGEVPLSGDVATAVGATVGLGDGRTDIVLAGHDQFFSVAVSNGDGSFGDHAYSFGDSAFATWQLRVGATSVAGDFDGDGKMDVALVGGTGWTSIPVSFAPSIGSGTTIPGRVTNLAATDFPIWATVSGARPVSGDFDGDGLTDIALTGGAGWTSVPVAFSNGNGSFRITNAGVANVPTWAQVSGAKPVAGDFDGDGRIDIALVGGSGWWTLPVAFSNGNGSFRITNAAIADFSDWAQVSGAKPVAGDFDGDGRTDIALTGGIGWWSVPVAFSNGDGTFRVTNATVQNIPSWATVPHVTPVGGVFR